MFCFTDIVCVNITRVFFVFIGRVFAFRIVTGDCFARMGISLHSELLPLRVHKFMPKLQSSDNLYCRISLLL
jgi:hypothetical protein